MRERLAGYVERREVPGLVALVAHGDEVRVEVLGTPALDDPTPLRRDAVFRIASLTKPITAAPAMTLDGHVAPDAPVEAYLREPDDTVPAERSITVEDLLTDRLGFGTVVEVPPGSRPIQRAEAALGLATLSAPCRRPRSRGCAA